MYKCTENKFLNSNFRLYIFASIFFIFFPLQRTRSVSIVLISISQISDIDGKGLLKDKVYAQIPKQEMHHLLSMGTEMQTLKLSLEDALCGIKTTINNQQYLIWFCIIKTTHCCLPQMQKLFYSALYIKPCSQIGLFFSLSSNRFSRWPICYLHTSLILQYSVTSPVSHTGKQQSIKDILCSQRISQQVHVQITTQGINSSPVCFKTQISVILYNQFNFSIKYLIYDFPVLHKVHKPVAISFFPFHNPTGVQIILKTEI